jgi:hypothetical protein
MASQQPMAAMSESNAQMATGSVAAQFPVSPDGFSAQSSAQADAVQCSFQPALHPNGPQNTSLPPATGVPPDAAPVTGLSYSDMYAQFSYYQGYQPYSYYPSYYDSYGYPAPSPYTPYPYFPMDPYATWAHGHFTQHPDSTAYNRFGNELPQQPPSKKPRTALPVQKKLDLVKWGRELEEWHSKRGSVGPYLVSAGSSVDIFLDADGEIYCFDARPNDPYIKAYIESSLYKDQPGAFLPLAPLPSNTRSRASELTSQEPLWKQTMRGFSFERPRIIDDLLPNEDFIKMNDGERNPFAEALEGYRALCVAFLGRRRRCSGHGHARNDTLHPPTRTLRTEEEELCPEPLQITEEFIASPDDLMEPIQLDGADITPADAAESTAADATDPAAAFAAAPAPADAAGSAIADATDPAAAKTLSASSALEPSASIPNAIQPESDEEPEEPLTLAKTCCVPFELVRLRRRARHQLKAMGEEARKLKDSLIFPLWDKGKFSVPSDAPYFLKDGQRTATVLSVLMGEAAIEAVEKRLLEERAEWTALCSSGVQPPGCANIDFNYGPLIPLSGLRPWCLAPYKSPKPASAEKLLRHCSPVASVGLSVRLSCNTKGVITETTIVNKPCPDPPTPAPYSCTNSANDAAAAPRANGAVNQGAISVNGQSYAVPLPVFLPITFNEEHPVIASIILTDDAIRSYFRFFQVERKRAHPIPSPYASYEQWARAALLYISQSMYKYFQSKPVPRNAGAGVVKSIISTRSAKAKQLQSAASQETQAEKVSSTALSGLSVDDDDGNGLTLLAAVISASVLMSACSSAAATDGKGGEISHSQAPSPPVKIPKEVPLPVTRWQSMIFVLGQRDTCRLHRFDIVFSIFAGTLAGLTREQATLRVMSLSSFEGLNPELIRALAIIGLYDFQPLQSDFELAAQEAASEHAKPRGRSSPASDGKDAFLREQLLPVMGDIRLRLALGRFHAVSDPDQFSDRSDLFTGLMYALRQQYWVEKEQHVLLDEGELKRCIDAFAQKHGSAVPMPKAPDRRTRPSTTFELKQEVTSMAMRQTLDVSNCCQKTVYKCSDAGGRHVSSLYVPSPLELLEPIPVHVKHKQRHPRNDSAEDEPVVSEEPTTDFFGVTTTNPAPLQLWRAIRLGVPKRQSRAPVGITHTLAAVFAALKEEIQFPSELLAMCIRYATLACMDAVEAYIRAKRDFQFIAGTVKSAKARKEQDTECPSNEPVAVRAIDPVVSGASAPRDWFGQPFMLSPPDQVGFASPHDPLGGSSEDVPVGALQEVPLTSTSVAASSAIEVLNEDGMDDDLQAVLGGMTSLGQKAVFIDKSAAHAPGILHNLEDLPLNDIELWDFDIARNYNEWNAAGWVALASTTICPALVKAFLPVVFTLTGGIELARVEVESLTLALEKRILRGFAPILPQTEVATNLKLPSHEDAFPVWKGGRYTHLAGLRPFQGVLQNKVHMLARLRGRSEIAARDAALERFPRRPTSSNYAAARVGVGLKSAMSNSYAVALTSLPNRRFFVPPYAMLNQVIPPLSAAMKHPVAEQLCSMMQVRFAPEFKYLFGRDKHGIMSGMLEDRQPIGDEFETPDKYIFIEEASYEQIKARRRTRGYRVPFISLCQIADGSISGLEKAFFFNDTIMESVLQGTLPGFTTIGSKKVIILHPALTPDAMHNKWPTVSESIRSQAVELLRPCTGDRFVWDGPPLVRSLDTDYEAVRQTMTQSVGLPWYLHLTQMVEGMLRDTKLLPKFRDLRAFLEEFPEASKKHTPEPLEKRHATAFSRSADLAVPVLADTRAMWLAAVFLQTEAMRFFHEEACVSDLLSNHLPGADSDITIHAVAPAVLPRTIMPLDASFKVLVKAAACLKLPPALDVPGFRAAHPRR